MDEKIGREIFKNIKMIKCLMSLNILRRNLYIRGRVYSWINDKNIENLVNERLR